MSIEPLIKVFGGKASVYLRHEGDIHTLAKKLSRGLLTPDFEIAPSEWPPYEVVGSLEVLGWELWLEHVQTVESFHYALRMGTEHSETECFNGDVHDLSPWLARYISLICDVESLVKGTQVMFSRGKPIVLASVAEPRPES